MSHRGLNLTTSLMTMLWLLAATPVAAAPDDAGAGGGDSLAPTLTAQELLKYFEPYVADVRQCYVTNAGRAEGKLRLELVIHRDGSVFRFDFAAPGVTGTAQTKLGTCLSALSKAWHFPVRRSFTTAVIPFAFKRVTPPDKPRSTCAIDRRTDLPPCVPSKPGAPS